VSNTVTLTITNTGTTTVYSGSNDPDSPLYGLQVVVPDQGAYDQYHSVLCSGDTSLTVTRETTLTVGTPLPAGAYDYSHSFNFVSSVGYPFRTPVTVTLPYDPNLAATPLGAGDVPMPFFWDAHYSKWVAASLKSIDSGQHTVTFTTLLPGRYAVLGIPGLGASVVKNLTPAFSWGTDDWLQWNTGNFTSPGGSSLGMSALASWYFPLWKANAGNTTKLNTGLHSVFASAADVNARALMSRMANGTLENWNGAWKQQFISASGPVNYALTDTQTGLALITALTIAAQPQVFLMADARPATANAVATAIYGYDGAGAFSVMDPNYPGDATTRLTIAWDPTANAGAGQFSAYARAGGYNPALAQYALEGETSIHRLSDYELVFDGATRATPWQHPPFATLAMTAIGDSSQVANLTVTQRVTPPSLGGPAVFVVTGHVVNGSDSPAHDTVFLSMNGGTRIAQLLDASGNFAFNVSHPLPNPYGTPFMLETTPDPCDPTFQHSGFQAFKVASLDPWFVNNCFENGAANPTPWVVQYGNNTSVSYPAYPAFTTDPHQGTGTQVATNQSTLMDANSVPMDPNVPTIPAVLGGRYSYRINGPVTQQKVGRMYQSVTVPATVANPTLTFYWAAVMQSAGHVPAQLPYVDIEVLDVTNGNEQVFFVHHFAPSTTGGVTYTDLYPGWIAGNGTGAAQWFGIDWQKVGLQLGTNRGSHVLTVRITAADCNQGGHGGYAYIDNLECD
jgi:hypothetical protein